MRTGEEDVKMIDKRARRCESCEGTHSLVLVFSLVEIFAVLVKMAT